MEVTSPRNEKNSINIVYPGITDSRPKHPEYALLSIRQKSFCQWHTNNNIDPDVLSKAGFAFTGKKIHSYFHKLFLLPMITIHKSE